MQIFHMVTFLEKMLKWKKTCFDLFGLINFDMQNFDN